MLFNHASFRPRGAPAFALIDDLADIVNASRSTSKQVPMEIFESPESYLIRAALPGFGKEQVKIDMDGNVLTIQAERPKTPSPEGMAICHSDGFQDKLARSIELPQEVDAQASSAKCEQGILEIRLPKFAPLKRAVRVE